MSEQIEIDQIEVIDRLRTVDEDHVAVIAESIRQCGRVLQPVVVARYAPGKDELRPRYVLVAGAHRLAAARLAGLMDIPAVIDEETDPLRARLIEIDENLIQHNLNPLDRAVFLAERKRIYEELHPEAKQGGDRKSDKARDQNDTMSFCSDAAEKTGLSARSIERAVRIHSRLNPELRGRIAGTDLARNQSELLNLVKYDHDIQAQVVDLLFAEAPKVAKVSEAVKVAMGHVDVPTSAFDKQFSKLIDAWNRAGLAAQRQFLSTLAENGDVILPEAKLEVA